MRADQSPPRWTDAADPRRRVGHTVEWHAEIGSTNDRARELLAADGDGVAVVADLQSAGRGRRGRSWLSAPGRNLAVSVGLTMEMAATSAWQLGPSAALAMHAACATAAEVGLKWPNDLVTLDGERKLGGLLVETAVDGDRLAGAVVGMGINVNWTRRELPDELREVTTSLRELSGRSTDRVALLGALLTALDAEIASLEAGRSPLERYRSACVTLGTPVRVETADGPVEGVAREIGARGELVVESGGRRMAVTNGDVIRLRPVEA
ncbi:MAG: biotin--[acetyl-CoA-carboxylase] ligase, partial [Candidatus Limnocylindria bacterium]